MPSRFSSSLPLSGLHISHRTSVPPRICWSCAFRSLFHTTSRRLANATNHYETLGIAPGSSQADIKKQYYTLSKTTHPDRNPNDPNAAARFSAVSDAYATLGHPDKRARYDRDVMRTRSPVPQRSGSHSSSGPGGTSKRKSPFRGPPRSFYDGGGYGKYGDKRSAEAEQTATNARRRSGQFYTSEAGTQGGFSHGQGATRGYDNDVPHFDREAHYRTQESMEGRFKRRVREEDLEYLYRGSPGIGTWTSGVLVTFVMATGLLFSAWVMRDRKKGKDGDG